MASEALPENSRELQQLIRQCGSGSSREKALLRRLSRHVSGENGRISSTILGNLLVQAFGRCGDVGSARAVFESIASKNVFSWNILVAAYAQNGLLRDAEATFEVMPLRNSVSWNTMISAYAQFGHLSKAQELFDCMLGKDSASWTGMMTAVLKHGQPGKVLRYFRLMDLEGVPPTELTFIVAAEACVSTAPAPENCMRIHRCASERGFDSSVMVATALVGMYSKLGDVESARRVFEAMPNQNQVSWNTMFGAYTRNSCVQEAAVLFGKIPQRDVVTWNLLLSMYSQMGDRCEAFLTFKKLESEVTPTGITFVTLLGCVSTLMELKMVWSKILRSGLFCEMRVATALVEAYARCGSLEEARGIFQTILERDTVAWNVMLGSYARLGKQARQEGLELFREMNLEGVSLNDFTFTVVLSICSHGGMFEEGVEVFGFMTEGCGIAASPEHYRCVVDLCGRVGWLKEARKCFRQMPDSRTLTSLVGASKLQTLEVGA